MERPCYSWRQNGRQEMEILSVLIFSYKQVRNYQHIWTGLCLSNKGFFAWKGLIWLFFGFGFFSSFTDSILMTLAFVWNCKVVDARGRIASSEVGEWAETFKWQKDRIRKKGMWCVLNMPAYSSDFVFCTQHLRLGQSQKLSAFPLSCNTSLAVYRGCIMKIQNPSLEMVPLEDRERLGWRIPQCSSSFACETLY